jgi:hypothetical protein
VRLPRRTNGSESAGRSSTKRTGRPSMSSSRNAMMKSAARPGGGLDRVGHPAEALDWRVVDVDRLSRPGLRGLGAERAERAGHLGANGVVTVDGNPVDDETGYQHAGPRDPETADRAGAQPGRDAGDPRTQRDDHERLGSIVIPRGRPDARSRHPQEHDAPGTARDRDEGVDRQGEQPERDHGAALPGRRDGERAQRSASSDEQRNPGQRVGPDRRPPPGPHDQRRGTHAEQLEERDDGGRRAREQPLECTHGVQGHVIGARGDHLE